MNSTVNCILSKYLSVTIENLQKLSHTIHRPHLFIVTDGDGYAQGCMGSRHMMNAVLESGFEKGVTHVRLLAKDRQPEEGRGNCLIDQHEIASALSGCTGFYEAIETDLKVLGYLCFFIESNMDQTLVAPLMKSVSTNIVNLVNTFDFRQYGHELNELFDQYRFTTREKEVALEWIFGSDVYEIGEKLSITDQTVRTYVKKIYYKSGCCHRGEFINKFLKIRKLESKKERWSALVN